MKRKLSFKSPLLKTIKKFLTNIIIILLTVGSLLIIIGQTTFLSSVFHFVSPTNPIHSIIRSIGATLIGSGVFTAIIKSTEYSQVFTNLLGEIIWSKDYIAKRGDIKEVWSTVSRLMYDEKFPDISGALEKIITEEYFPINHNFFLENYEFMINIKNIPNNPNFWFQEEEIRLTIKPKNSNEKIEYPIRSSIDLPENKTLDDLTEYNITEVIINGENRTSVYTPSVNIDQNLLHHLICLQLENQSIYNVLIKRNKTVYKKTNLDKRFFVLHICNNIKVTIIFPDEYSIDLYRMGTIKDFVKSTDERNENVKIKSWYYDGIVLPYQGYILMVK